MTLTAEQTAHLRRPFTPEAVGFRADAAKPDRAGRVRCVVYIDARLARERLTDVDPSWWAEYEFVAVASGDPCGFQYYTPMRCELTVLGVTRTGFGQVATKGAGANTVKAAQSDALKRAAVEFHVGAYLYALKQFYAKATDCWIDGDKVKALNREAIIDLRKQYKKMIEHKLFVDRFGLATHYGEIEDNEKDTHTQEVPASVTVGQPAPRVEPPKIKVARSTN